MKIIQYLKKIAIIITAIVAIKIILSLFFNFIYYPNNPNRYTKYIMKSDDPSDMIIGGCFDSCTTGREQKISCKAHNGAYDICDYDCYGYVYKSCGVSSLDVVQMLLVR